MKISPVRFIGSKLHGKNDFPNPSYYNVKLFSLLGGRAMIWDSVYRGIMVSLKAQTPTLKLSMD